MHRSLRADIEFLPLDDVSWRLCDTRVEARDASSLIGYVERTGASYEVLWLWGRAGPDTYRTRAAVRESALAHLPHRHS